MLVASLCRVLSASVLLSSVAAWSGAQARRPSDSVVRYLGEALDTLRRVALRRDSVDWNALRDSLLVRAAGAQSTRDAWPALQWALRRVDRHSFLQTPEPPRVTTSPNEQAAPRPRPPAVSGRLIDGRIGYVLVPWFSGRNRPSFVDSLQSLIREYDVAGACGWVVDLRLNQGGNMWPMLAGVGPLLGDSIFGSFVVAGQADTPWRYVRGNAWSGGGDSVPDWAARGTQTPHSVRDRYAPVAVLMGRETASSGEATAIAFHGRPNVRTFGDSTAGFASINRGVSLRDSATMVVTIGYSRDRAGTQYGLRLTPDEIVARGSDPSRDATLDRAVAWLAEQRACTRRS